MGLAASVIGQYVRWLARSGKPPYPIYPGASGRLGILGYVNAALEIRDQIAAGAAPLPDAIVVAVGSCGTFTGLLLGLRLAELPVRLIGVRVTGRDVSSRGKIARLANGAARYLRQRAPSVPALHFEADEIELWDNYHGGGYAHPTPEGEHAVAMAGDTEGLPQETTYTGKAMAALLDHATAHPGTRLMFVDTFAENPILPEGDYHDLPERSWPVFDAGHPARCACLQARRNRAYCWHHD